MKIRQNPGKIEPMDRGQAEKMRTFFPSFFS